MVKYTAALAALILTACGGGGDAQPSQAAAAPCVPRVVTIDLYGNSIAYAMTAHLQGAVDAKFGAGGVVVRYKAKGGSKVFDLVNGTRGFDRWPAGADADITLQAFWGTNEAAHSHRDPLEQFRGALHAIARPGDMLITPPPMDLTVTDPNIGTDEVEAYVAAMKDQARADGTAVLDAHAYVSRIPGWPQMLLDGLHPGPQLQEWVVRDVVMPGIVHRVNSLRCV